MSTPKIAILANVNLSTFEVPIDFAQRTRAQQVRALSFSCCSLISMYLNFDHINLTTCNKHHRFPVPISSSVCQLACTVIPGPRDNTLKFLKSTQNSQKNNVKYL